MTGGLTTALPEAGAQVAQPASPADGTLESATAALDFGALRIAELVGPVGAGKSTLLRHLEQALADRGIVTLPPALAVDRGLGRSILGPVVRPLLARPRTAPLVRQLLVELPYGLGTLVGRPRLGFTVVRALVGAPIPGWHRRVILRLWLEVAGRVAFARPRLAPGEVIVFDEGLVHRAVNLFAWHPEATAGAVIDYLSRLPRPDFVVVVLAAPDVTADRLAARGLPKRLQGRDEDDVAAFLRRVRRVLETTDTWLAATGVPTARIDNTGPIETLAAALESELQPILRSPAGSVGQLAPATHAPLFRPRLAALPRVWRTSLPGRHRPAGLDERLVSEVLDRVGLHATGDGRPIAGGRGTSAVVATRGGHVLVKRYKASVDEMSLRGEHAVLRRLELARFPAPRLIAGQGGETLFEVGGSLYAVFEYLDGYRRADAGLRMADDARHLAAVAGETLGALHATLDGFLPPTTSPNGFISPVGRRVRDVDWYRDRLSMAADATRTDDPEARELVDAAGTVAGELTRLDTRLEDAVPTRGVIHGDYGPYNLLTRPRRPLVVVDFELARLDWLLTDLVTALPRFAAGRTRPSSDRGLAFGSGYLRRRALPASEVALLPAVGAYLALRRSIVCWARWTETKDRQWLAEATEKMDLAMAYRERRHPLMPVFDALVTA